MSSTPTGLHSPLCHAVLNGDSATARELLAAGADAREQDAALPLLTLAVLRGDAATTRRLLAQGANPNHKDIIDPYFSDEEGTYPLLMLAVLRDSVPTARALLEAGADTRAESFACAAHVLYPSMARHFALFRHGHYQEYGLPHYGLSFLHATPIRFVRSARMARLLISHGASLANEYSHYLGCRKASPRLTEELLRGTLEACIREQNPGGLPLHEAAFTGRADLLELMLEAGGDPHSLSEGRNIPMFRKGRPYTGTPLHYAANAKVVQVLLAYGANINALNKNGLTPLRRARNAEVAAALRAHGAAE